MQRGQPSKNKPKPAPRPTELVLGSIPSPVPANTFYRGTLVSRHPYHATGHHATLVLAPLPHAAQGSKKMEVRLQGTWAEDALNYEGFVVGKTVAVQAEGGKRQLVSKKRKAAQAEEGVQFAEYRLAFDRRFAGFVWTRKEEDDVTSFEFVARPSTNNTSAAAGRARTELPSPSPDQHVPTTSKPLASRPAPSVVPEPVASTSRSVSPPPSDNPSALSGPALKPVPATTDQSIKNTSPEPPKVRADKSSTFSRAEKDVLATSQEKVDGGEEGKGKQKVDMKRKSSQEGEGSRTQKRKKKLERKWELEVTKKDDPIFGKNATIVYTPLSKHDRSKNAKGLNVIAVACVQGAPRRAERGDHDWTTSLRLVDPTRLDQTDIITFFSKQENELPKVEDGDIVLLQNINWSNTKQNFIGYIPNGRSLVFPRAKLLASPPTADNAFLRTALKTNRFASGGPAEIEYARDMALFMESESTALAAAGVGGDREEAKKMTAEEKSAALRKGGSAKRALVQVKDMVEDKFCDTVVEVVRVWTNNLSIKNLSNNDCITVYVSDYTKHPDVFVAEMANQLPHAMHGLALQVSVFGSQAQPLQDVAQGRLLHLRNLRPKLNVHGLLEASIFPDYKYPNKKDVTVLRKGDYKKEVDALCERREIWWPTRNDDVDAPGEDIILSTPNAAAAKSNNPLPSVICEQIADPIINMSDALATRLKGIYHFQGRVIDYHPPKFEEWVHAYCLKCDEHIDKSCDRCLDHPTASTALMLWGVIRVVDDSLPSSHEGIPVLIREGSESALFPSLRLTPDMRHPSSPSALTLQQRLAPILGNLISLKKKKNKGSSHKAKPEEEEEVQTPEFDMSLEATVSEGGEMSWGWARGMKFAQPAP